MLLPIRRMIPSGLTFAVVLLSTASVLSDSVRVDHCDETQPYCGDGRYCDPHSYSCKSCAVICDIHSLECNEKCKDYLLLTELRSTVNNQKITIVVLAVVTTILLIGFLVLVLIKKIVNVQCLRMLWQKKNDSTPTVVMTHENPNTKSPTRAPKNPANLARQNTQQTTGSTTEQDVENQTTITTISNRYPAEDSTEGLAYVNHACNVTSTSNGSAARF